MARRGSFTLQDSIDEENRTVLADFENRRSASPAIKRGMSPSSPQSSYVRSTLRVDSPTPRHGSIAGIGVGVTSPSQSRKKRLDPADPSTWTSPHAIVPIDHRPRASSETHRADVPLITFDSIPDVKGEKEPHEATRERKGSRSMAAALSGDLDSLHITSPNLQADPSEATSKSTGATDATLSPKSTGEQDTPHHRSLSNQSASFSTDSDQIGAVSRDGEKEEEVEEAVQDSSSDNRSESEDEGSPVAERGRKRKSSHEPESPEATKAGAPSQIQVSPEIKVDEVDARDEGDQQISPSGKFSETKGSIVPRSNYRAASPAALSAIGNDDDELRRAKAMELKVSPLDEKIKDRTVKMIIRGEWESFQDHEDEQQGYRHEPRFYLVCSDLSNEASYALEWTVGTLLKDGDTLLILSAFEDENAAKHKDKDHEEPSLEVRLESAKAAEEANSTMATLTRQTTNLEGGTKRHSKSPLVGLSDHNRSTSRSSRPRTKRDEERIKAVDKIEADFLRYVRKTALQVRCMFEVIHCRSPRHLVLNAIDELEPTLVVVGTRGLSSVKGVMLGSFSNYLVQKSSIPVMVARKRLKKARGAKVNSSQIRMTNNLNPFGLPRKRKSLTQARID